MLVNSAAEVAEFLGRPKLVREERNQLGGVPGVAIGLAVTGAGGDVLFVEATSFASGASDVGLTVTGQLGDVMKESASIALSYVRAHADQLGVDVTALEGKRIHVHFPAGAVPKDGPSAGITMTTALVSLLTGRPVDPSVGMTGEVTLSGRVLPIGGLNRSCWLPTGQDCGWSSFLNETGQTLMMCPRTSVIASTFDWPTTSQT